MASASGSSRPFHRQHCEEICNKLSSAQDDDDHAIWMSYISLASIEDAHLIDGWTKIIDVTLVYVSAQLQEILFMIEHNIGGTLQWYFDRIHRTDVTRLPTSSRGCNQPTHHRDLPSPIGPFYAH